MTRPTSSDANHAIEVFISYSRDGDVHREWVGRLADRLDREPDLHVAWDEYDLYGGKDLPHFMERCASCDRVVIIVTPRFVEKADQRHGGVGYETAIAAAELATRQTSDKFIPVLREGSDLPRPLTGKFYVDFRDDSNFERGVQDLLRAIRRQTNRSRPAKRVIDDHGAVELTVPKLANALRERTIDAHSGEVIACQSCGSSDLEHVEDADVEQEWEDGSVVAHLNYLVDIVECRECGWNRTEFSDRDGNIFERKLTEGRS